ncbi:MAG: histidine phosphotransferase family protein [Pelagimonas sp.]|jgi:histidine phosphotransferase ChpT|nr:histidine phosphotransferase family protein [Pelagimonas sp.]
MTDTTQARLASLIGSRLCHDLISPIGAIQNGLELVELSGSVAGDSPEFSLIQESCQNAAARIKFFRVAFGSAASTQMMSSREVQTVLQDMTKGGRVSVGWSPQGDLPRAEVQLAFLALMCCESALPMGGSAQIDMDAAGWSIRAEGRRLTMDDTLWDHLNGAAQSEPEPHSKTVQFLLLAILSEQLDKKILVTHSENTLTVKIA